MVVELFFRAVYTKSDRGSVGVGGGSGSLRKRKLLMCHTTVDLRVELNVTSFTLHRKQRGAACVSRWYRTPPQPLPPTTASLPLSHA